MAKSQTELDGRGQPQVYSGTASSTAAAVTPTKVPMKTIIVNSHASNLLYYNFDNGSNWAVIPAMSSHPFLGSWTSIYVKSDSGKTCGYSITIETKLEGAV